MSERIEISNVPLKPGRIAVIVLYLCFAAVLMRTFGVEENLPFLSNYLRLELAYLILFTLVLWKYTLPGWLIHLYLVTQSALVLAMLSLNPEFDFVVLLLVILTYQVVLAFSGRMLWIWIGTLMLLTSGSLMFFMGVLRGLAISLTSIAGEIVIPTFILANYETEKAQRQSQLLLEEIQSTHRQSQLYAGQVEELAAMQERNRLARELHDTVSQLIFSISLTARSAQILLEKEPQCVAEPLNRLQEMSAEALRQLRSLILQLRPPQN